RSKRRRCLNQQNRKPPRSGDRAGRRPGEQNMGPTAGTEIAGKTVLVTGANRGLGQALVEEALKRGAKRVYAGARQPYSHSDDRVTPLTLDVTNSAQIQEAVERVESLDILINNAGISLPNDLSDRAALDRHLAVNLFGPWDLTEAFLPSLVDAK